MRRRQFLSVVAGAVLSPLAARAQQTDKVAHIGFLRVGPPPQSFIDAFGQGLREQGLIQGQNIVIDWEVARNVAQLPDALAELTRHQVDVLVASGTSSVLLTKDAAGTIPVVFVAAVEPVAMGLVADLTRPAGKVTGITAMAEELDGDCSCCSS